MFCEIDKYVVYFFIEKDVTRIQRLMRFSYAPLTSTVNAILLLSMQSAVSVGRD